jgi:hypothetical protein
MRVPVPARHRVENQPGASATAQLGSNEHRVGSLSPRNTENSASLRIDQAPAAPDKPAAEKFLQLRLEVNHHITPGPTAALTGQVDSKLAGRPGNLVPPTRIGVEKPAIGNVQLGAEKFLKFANHEVDR